MPVNVHSGTGNPDYGSYPVSMLLYINEVPFYTQRPFVQMVMSGVFERFPRLKFVMTEAGCSWVPPLLAGMDRVIRGIRETGATGEIRYGDEHVLSRDATEYFEQNCWMGVSQPGPADVEARHKIGIDKFMWGSDYPHDEGTHPYTREHLRARFHDTPEAGVAQDAGRQRGQALRLRPGCSGTARSHHRSRLWPRSRHRSTRFPTSDSSACRPTWTPERSNERLGNRPSVVIIDEPAARRSAGSP